MTLYEVQVTVSWSPLSGPSLGAKSSPHSSSFQFFIVCEFVQLVKVAAVMSTLSGLSAVTCPIGVRCLCSLY